MEFVLKQGSTRLQIPVNPESYSVQSSQNNTSVNVNGLGEVNLRGKRNLMTITWSSFFPHALDSFCDVTSIKTPKAYVELIEKMKRKGTVKVQITGTTVNTNCTIEEFTWGEEDGTGDINYSITFKEYRKLNIPQGALQMPVSPAPEVRETPPAQETTTYTVKKGDCLSAIAKKLTGSADWKPIYEANKSAIGSNPNLIQIGLVLTIPNSK